MEEKDVFLSLSFMRRCCWREEKFLRRNGRVVAELNHRFSLPISPMVTIEKSFRS